MRHAIDRLIAQNTSRRRGQQGRAYPIQDAVAISPPFFNGAGDVLGSLSAFGPSVCLSDARILKFAPLLIRAAREISQVLGKARADTGR